MSKMTKKTVGELLVGAGSSFDPMTYDTTAIRELSNLLPSSGSIDLAKAEILATKFLRGADICSELMSIAFVYVSKCETLKKKAYSEAALVKAGASGIKTDKARCLYADADDDYIAAANKYSEAMAFFKWVSSKYESMSRAHYLCKHMLDREYNHQQAAGGAVESEKLYEVDNSNKGEETW